MVGNLRKVINTLNQVEVHGSANMNMLLACIQELERLERRMTDADQTAERRHV